MPINFQIYKTNELKDSDFQSLSKIYKDSFGKLFSSILFKNKYIKGDIGFSYHALFFDNNQSLIGSFTVMPKKFHFNEKIVIGLHLQDTCFPYSGLVNPFSIKKVVFEVIQYALKDLDDVFFLYGFPNQKIEKLWIKLLNWQYIDTLCSCIDFFPLLTLLFNMKVNSQNDLYITDRTIGQIQSRLNTKKSYSLKIKSKTILIFWIINRIVPVQIIDNLNLRKKFTSSIINSNWIFLKLFIPSISAFTSKNPKRIWQINLKMPKFPLYFIALNDEMKKSSINFSCSYSWNDVP